MKRGENLIQIISIRGNKSGSQKPISNFRSSRGVSELLVRPELTVRESPPRTEAQIAAVDSAGDLDRVNSLSLFFLSSLRAAVSVSSCLHRKRRSVRRNVPWAGSIGGLFAKTGVTAGV